MSKLWIKIDDLTVNIENIPSLLDRYNLLPNFLRRLLESKYTHKITTSQEEQVAYFNLFLKNNKINSKDSLNDWLNDNGLDDKRLDLMLFEKLQIEKLKKEMFEAKVEQIYIDRKPLLDKVMYSALRVKDRSQAEELFIQIEEKESTFSDLVSQYSVGSEKEFNGILGPIEFGKIDPLLRERLRASNNGQLWPPFEFKNNWVIIRHEKFVPSKLDQNMKLRIMNTLYEEWINKKVIDLLEVIRYKKNIEGNNKNTEITTGIDNLEDSKK